MSNVPRATDVPGIPLVRIVWAHPWIEYRVIDTPQGRRKHRQHVGGQGELAPLIDFDTLDDLARHPDALDAIATISQETPQP